MAKTHKGVGYLTGRNLSVPSGIRQARVDALATPFIYKRTGTLL
jgi:hypothetical protein